MSLPMIVKANDTSSTAVDRGTRITFYSKNRNFLILMKQLLLLFIITLIFLIFFTGLTWLIDYYYPPDEYTHSTIGGQFPTKMKLLFGGFRNSKVIFDSLAITVIYCPCVFKFLHAGFRKNKFWDIILRSLILALSLGSLFFTYKFISLGFNLAVFNFFWKANQQILILIIGLYFIIAVIFLSFLLVPGKVSPLSHDQR